jgi:hypothetical protein
MPSFAGPRSQLSLGSRPTNRLVRHSPAAAHVRQPKKADPRSGSGDCALSLRTLVASRQRLRWAHHLASWTVAATGCSFAPPLRLTRMGGCRTKAEGLAKSGFRPTGLRPSPPQQSSLSNHPRWSPTDRELRHRLSSDQTKPQRCCHSRARS